MSQQTNESKTLNNLFEKVIQIKKIRIPCQKYLGILFILVALVIQIQANNPPPKTSKMAGPHLTLWQVEGIPHEKANFWPCGFEYYFRYQKGLIQNEIIEIKNEGDEDLVLNLPITLAEGSFGPIIIAVQPTQSILAPGEETHFIVRHNAGPNYVHALAQIEIASNEVGQENCLLTFEVGQVVVEPPVNDQCDNAIFIDGDEQYCGTTIGADADLPNGGATCGTGSDAEGNGVWYSFQGTGELVHFIFPASAGWDPEINIYTGSCGNYTCVAGDDDSGGGLTAEVEFLTVIDQPYFIYVHSAFVNSGDNEFCFTAEGLVSLPPVDIPTLSQWFIIILIYILFTY